MFARHRWFFTTILSMAFTAMSLDVYGVPADEINWGWNAYPPTFPNEAYGPLTDVDPDLRGDNQLFDVWCPDGEGPFPCYIYAHGGSFIGGSKILYSHPGKYLPDDDVVFMNINYRLDGNHLTGIADGLAMVQYVKANAAKYKVDPEKIVLGGNSAGGIIMSEIIYSHQEPGIIGLWSLNPWYQNDYSPARLAAYPIPVVQVAFDPYPANNNHSALLAFTHASDNWSLGLPSIFMGGGGGDYTFGYEETYDYNPQLWRNGAWIKNTEGVDTGEAVPTLGEWINEIAPNLGYDSFFMGHSFFAGQVNRLSSRAAAAGLTEHVQQDYFSAGDTGMPLNLWNDPANSAAIKAILDGGGIELFGMVIDEGVEGYMNWIDYALASNPLKQVMIGMSWVDFPSQMTLNEAEAQFDSYIAMLHGQIDTLRTTYPDLEFYCIPYGEAATELRALYEADNLPQITAFTGPAASSLHTDDKGHAGDMMNDTTTLVWLSAIYGVDLLTLDYDTGWQIDAQLKQIATDILSGHDSAYNSTEYNSAQPVEFWVSATKVYAGESVTLSWNVLGAEWIFIDLGAENIVSTNSAIGSVDVLQPLGTNTYVLIATNSSGSVTQEVVVVATVAPGTLVDTILFNDTFDTADTTDLDTSLSSRQAAGLLTSTYTEQIDANSLIEGNKLRRTATGIVTLDTNFASHIGNQPFTLSFDFFAVTETNQWTAIHVKNAVDVTRNLSPMQVYFRGDNSVNNLIFLQYGTGSSVSSLLISSNTLATALGSAFSIHDEHNYAFEASPTDPDPGSGTYDFLVDGVAVAENLPYTFSENTERIIVFTGLNLDARFDNLDITVLAEEMPFSLSISVDNTSSLSFEWGSILGKQYDLESITSLLLTNWTAYNDGVTLYENIPASGTGSNSLTGVLAPASNAFFRVNEKD